MAANLLVRSICFDLSAGNLDLRIGLRFHLFRRPVSRKRIIVGPCSAAIAAHESIRIYRRRRDVLVAWRYRYCSTFLSAIDGTLRHFHSSGETWPLTGEINSWADHQRSISRAL